MTQEQEFLRMCFRKYYQDTDITPPPRFTRREWAFFPFDSHYMTRHMEFKTYTEIKKFLSNRVPKHVYCSSAYYRHPSITPMSLKEEGWLGADLIFDLDADHLKNADELNYEDQLISVKDMVKKLIFDFLIHDFGFNNNDIKLFFSGGRGYHVHITSPEILMLDSWARQEIVDYITANGLDMGHLFKKKIAVTKYKDKIIQEKLWYLYEQDTSGWKGKLRKGMNELIDIITSKDESETVKLIMDLKLNYDKCKNIGEHTAKIIYGVLTEHGDELKRNGALPVYFNHKHMNDFCHLIIAHSRLKLAGDIDEPVTKDIKRLLRVPGTLHGKTGFKVVEVDVSKLDDFNPLIDAIVFSDKPTKINVQKQFDGRLKDQEYNLDPGEANVPLYVAIFLLGRGIAKL